MKLLKSALSAIVLGSVAFSGPALAQGKPTVGIAMPTKASARWIDDGNNIVKVLKERGYNTDHLQDVRLVCDRFGRCSNTRRAYALRYHGQPGYEYHDGPCIGVGIGPFDFGCGNP